MKQALFVVSALVLAAFAAPVVAQDAVKVDSKHYKVEFENAQVRVLRVNYGPHEKSVMHSHPANVAVFLTDGQVKFTLADGKTQDATVKAGSVQWDAGGKHSAREHRRQAVRADPRGAQEPACEGCGQEVKDAE